MYVFFPKLYSISGTVVSQIYKSKSYLNSVVDYI